MEHRFWNWRLWAGFGVSLLAIASYFAFFHVIRLVPLVGAALFAVAAILLVSGLKRAYEQPQLYRGKVAGRVLASLSV
ncbi:MAG TPA: hypothetical protein VNW97_17815, partial [Candidatus Saccharimonadales bacterium]|nr:hypothetical protein [Candidatus Saccharimonadales bacterium]